MGLADELAVEVGSIFKSRWDVSDGRVIPDTDKLTFANTAIKIEGVVLYADLASSTKLVDTSSATFAAEIYKTFLYCCARIIKAQGGDITAYDGDRIMAVFVGEAPNTNAVSAALKINAARVDIIMPALKRQYSESTYQLQHVVGIDRSTLHAAKTGARGDNDLVWVGRAENHAAKLSALPPTHASYITKEVYDVMTDSAKLSNGVNMWEQATWNETGRTVYRSNWRRSV